MSAPLVLLSPGEVRKGRFGRVQAFYGSSAIIVE